MLKNIPEGASIVAAALFMGGVLYMSAAWPVFQWRNPLANKMSFFRDFVDVEQAA